MISNLWQRKNKDVCDSRNTTKHYISSWGLRGSMRRFRCTHMLIAIPSSDHSYVKIARMAYRTHRAYQQNIWFTTNAEQRRCTSFAAPAPDGKSHPRRLRRLRWFLAVWMAISRIREFERNGQRLLATVEYYVTQIINLKPHVLQIVISYRQ